MRGCKVGTEYDGIDTQYFEANTELRHSILVRAESVVMLFEVREEMEWSIHERQI